MNVRVFGESHAPEIGVEIEGVGKGVEIDVEELQRFLDRRAPGNGQGGMSTPRKEPDRPVFESGVVVSERSDRSVASPLESGVVVSPLGKRLVTTGETIRAVIRNTNVRPQDYGNVITVPRPGHADYSSWIKYGKISTGGGKWSGRMTAPLCIAGGIALQMLAKAGVEVHARVVAVGGREIAPNGQDARSPMNALMQDTSEAIEKPAVGSAVSSKPPYQFCGNACRCNSGRAASMMPPLAPGLAIASSGKDAALEGVCPADDSVGAVVEVVATGVPQGLGDVGTDGLESKLSAAFFGIPAVKGVEFGDGFKLAEMHGSEANDAFVLAPAEGPVPKTEGSVPDEACLASSVSRPPRLASSVSRPPAPVTLRTNHCGGILGGISVGTPIVARLAFKPTPSISREQDSVDLETLKPVKLAIKGRHDRCVAFRAVPVVEAAMAIVLANELKS